LCEQIISNSIINQKNKKDYAELNHVKYGLFSVDKWKEQISVILEDQINKLNLTNANEQDLKKHIEIQLNTFIDEIDKKIKESNSGTAKGWVKQAFINVFINMKEIKNGIPEYADAIIQNMTKSQTKTELKNIMKNRLKEYINQTFDVQDTSALDKILLETDSREIESAKIKLSEAISSIQNVSNKEALAFIILSVIVFALFGFSKQALLPSEYIPLVLSLIFLLIAGVTTPMIDMEAKISQMSFVLLDHTVHFENQILYFQSKSILDVFWIMITHNTLQMKLVGVLMVTFSRPLS